MNIKKIVLGTCSIVILALLTALAWGFIGSRLVLESRDLGRISLGVNTAVWLPLPVYCISVVAMWHKYRERIDTENAQPLQKPYSLGINLVLQCVTMILLGQPVSDNGQASTASMIALIMVIILGGLSLALALCVGRPISGKTRLPFTSGSCKNTDY